MTFAMRLQGYRNDSALIEGPYRYLLKRAWAPIGKTALVVMANPSAADGLTDDQTIRRLRQLLDAEGFVGFSVVNLFAWRATDPKDLINEADALGFPAVVGKDNDAHIRDELGRNEVVIAAWGSSTWKAFHTRLTVVRFFIEKADRPLLCFGRTKDGAPRHPSRLPRSAKLEELAW